MTAAELRERLANVPDHYEVVVDHVMYRRNGEPGTCKCSASGAAIGPANVAYGLVQAFIIDALECP